MPPSDHSDVGSIDPDGIVSDPPLKRSGGSRLSRRTDPDERISTAVVMAVAEVLGVDATTLTPPMHDVIDAEALDRLFDRSSDRTTGLRVEFEVYGCRVAVDGDRHLHVRRIA